jgi:hypothetical protein
MLFPSKRKEHFYDILAVCEDLKPPKCTFLQIFSDFEKMVGEYVKIRYCDKLITNSLYWRQKCHGIMSIFGFCISFSKVLEGRNVD